jgi:ferredoxin
MVPDAEGFLQPEIDHEKCVHCTLCETVCPVKEPEYPKAYAVINKDENVRSKSTSGGMFQLFAKEIIQQNGIVFGAKFGENMEFNTTITLSKQYRLQRKDSLSSGSFFWRTRYLE